jgi:hypothetical protein
VIIYWIIKINFNKNKFKNVVIKKRINFTNYVKKLKDEMVIYIIIFILLMKKIKNIIK